MSMNWVCPQCNAYNPPRRDRCWQCRNVRGECAPLASAEQIDGAPKKLKGYWLGYVALCLGALGVGYGVLRLWWSSAEILPWLLRGVVAVGIGAALLWHRLSSNHQKGVTQLLPNFRTSTFLTLGRAVLLALIVGFGGLSCTSAATNCNALWGNEITGSILRNWTPAILFTIVLLLSFIEKVLLRRNKKSVAVLDIELHRDIDMLGVLVASILGLAFWRLPVQYLLVPITYYMFRAGVWWRKRKAKPVFALPVNVLRELIVQSQIVFSGIALWPFWRSSVDEVATVFMLTFVAYQLKDWLIVVGALKPASPTYQKINGWVEKVVSYGPIVLRVLFVFSFIQWAFMSVFMVGQLISEPPDPQALERALPYIAAVVLVLFFTFLMIVLGVAGRIAALILLLASFLFFVPFRVFPFYLVALLYLGTGKLSLLTEDMLLARWMMWEAIGQRADKAQLLQSVALPQNRTSLEVPVAWTVPLKLSETLKAVIGLATFVLVGSYVLNIAFMLLMMITIIAQGAMQFPNLVENFTFFVWVLGILIAIVQLGLMGFYFVHVIKNVAASDTVRIILGLGMFLFPPVAMPVYYWTYIHSNSPPLWARKKVSIGQVTSELA